MIDYVLKPGWDVRLEKAARIIVATGFMLVLALLVFGYVRSYWPLEGCPFSWGGTQWEITSRNGVFVLDNLPQGILEAQARENRKTQVDPLVLKSRVLCSKRTLSSWEETACEIEENELIGRFKALGYVPATNLARLFNGRGRVLVFDPYGKPVFLSVPLPLPSTPAECYDIPYSVPFVLIGGWPLYAMMMTLARRISRFRGGLCLACGYDLRAGHERCPECGVPTAGQANASGRNFRTVIGTAITGAPELIRWISSLRLHDSGPFTLYLYFWGLVFLVPLPIQFWQAIVTLPDGGSQWQFSRFPIMPAIVELVIGLSTLYFVCRTIRSDRTEAMFANST